MGPRLILFGLAFFVVVGFVTAGLWNALMPAIFNLPSISYWQALGLLLLGRLLFGGFGGWRHRMGKARFVNGWKDLTPEERERFRNAMGSRCAERFAEGGEAEKA